MKIVSEQNLDNSLCIRITDQSRRIAADRWYIKMVCEVKMPLTDEHLEKMRADEGPEQFSAIRRLLGDEITMELVQERNFVDEAARQDVISGMLASIDENISGYLASASFPARFFGLRYRQAKKLSQLETVVPGDEPREDEDDGPADFSACFFD
ncbi:MAG: hypothetical protein ABR523_11850 [Desulfurivibrionaceae bacterium]